MVEKPLHIVGDNDFYDKKIRYAYVSEIVNSISPEFQIPENARLRRNWIENNLLQEVSLENLEPVNLEIEKMIKFGDKYDYRDGGTEIAEDYNIAFSNFKKGVILKLEDKARSLASKKDVDLFSIDINKYEYDSNSTVYFRFFGQSAPQNDKMQERIEELTNILLIPCVHLYKATPEFNLDEYITSISKP